MPKKLVCLYFFASISWLYPQEIPDNFTRAFENYFNGNYVAAYVQYSEISNDYGISDEIYAASKFKSANALLKLGQKEKAAAELEYIANHIVWSNFREEAFYNLGLIYFEFNNYSLARDRFTSLLKEFSRSTYSGSAMYWIGETYSAQNKLDEAIEFLHRAIDDKASNSFRDYTIFTLANTYEKKEDYNNAVKYYDELLSYYRNSPLVVSAQIRIGICYFHLKDYQSSILELNNPMLKDLPDDLHAESLYLLANSHYRVGEYPEAEKVYVELLENYPGTYVDSDTKYGLAWTYFQQNKYNDAFLLFNNLSSGSDSIAVESFFWKAEAKRYAGQTTESISIFRELLSKHAASYIIPRVEYQLGLLYFNTNDFKLARRYLLTAASSESEPVRYRAYTLLGELELKTKKYSSAKNYFESALKLNETEVDLKLRALLGAGSALYYLGKHTNALAYLDEIVLISRDFEKDRVNFYLAESYFSNKKYRDALARFNSIETQNSDIKKLALYGEAYCYFNLGDYENAAFHFTEFIRNYPSDKRITDSKLRLADSYFGSKNFGSSSRIYRELFSSSGLNVDDPYTYYQYAQALYKSGKIQSAISEFSRLQSKYPESAYADVSLYTIGWIYFQQGNFDDAIERYRNVLELYAGTSLAPVIFYSIGDSYFNLSDYNAAIVNYQKVLTEYTSSENVYDALNGIQYCYVAKNEPEKAIALIDQFVSQNPSLKYSDKILFKKGEIYYSLRNYEAAKESYKEFVERYADSDLTAEAYYWIGKSADNLEQYEDAIFYFNTAFQNFPESDISGSAVLEMGAIFNSLEQYNEAIASYDHAIKKLKDSQSIPEILYMKGLTYIKTDSLQQAYNMFYDVSRYHRETVFADQSKIEMGLIDLAAQRFESADKHFLEIAEKQNDELGAKAQYHYGLSLYEQEKYTDAISAFVRVRTIFSNYDEWLTKSYMALGDCYVKIDDIRKAEEMYRNVISRHKNDAFGKEARERIRQLK
ncbi:tetratricopeptide repeat protein [Bacteroidota bacterium]